MSPTRMASQEDAGDIFTPTPDTKIAHLAEVAALQQMTDTLGRMGKYMQQLGEDQKLLTAKVGEMHTDIALMKQQNEQMREIRSDLVLVKARLTAIELVHAQQDGAAKAFRFLKDFGPWLVAVVVALWGIFERAPK